jgi:signal transduction histidine kinase
MGKIEVNTKTYKMDQTDVKSLIQETVKLFDYRLKKEGFDCSTHLPQGQVVLQIDRDAVKQALTNIIDNAIKYSAHSKQISIHLLKRSNEVEIRIEDKGIGIPTHEQDLIFNNFFRGSGAEQKDPKGAGIGLKIVKHIMEAHKGKIKVKSRVNMGTTLSLIFKSNEENINH